MLLARYAESLFWFARYIERAASLARILNVQLAHHDGDISDQNWRSILSLYSDQKKYHAVHTQLNAKNIGHFYIADTENPGSIISTVSMARENASVLRPLISVSMWTYVNKFHADMKEISSNELSEDNLSRTCERIAEMCDAIMGITESTYYRDAGWRFYQMGLWIERADQTSRLLDVKLSQYAFESSLKKTYKKVEFWHLLLRSFEAYHAFQRVERGRMEPKKISEFLIFNHGFPRSLAYCIGHMHDTIHELYTHHNLHQAGNCYETIEKLLLDLQNAHKNPEFYMEFHNFNDLFQNQLAHLTNEIGDTFFGYSEDYWEIKSSGRKKADLEKIETSKDKSKTKAERPKKKQKKSKKKSISKPVSATSKQRQSQTQISSEE